MNRRPTFDAAPLLRHARLTLDRYEGVTPNDPGAASWAAVAELLGTNYRQVMRWLSGVRLHEETADRCAVALGLHPALIWPDWYEEPAVEDREDREAPRGERGSMRWQGRSIQVRVYAGHGRRLTANTGWRGSLEATEAAAEVLLERLLLQVDDDRLAAAR